MVHAHCFFPLWRSARNRKHDQKQYSLSEWTQWSQVFESDVVEQHVGWLQGIAKHKCSY